MGDPSGELLVITGFHLCAADGSIRLHNAIMTQPHTNLDSDHGRVGFPYSQSRIQAVECGSKRRLYTMVTNRESF